MQKGRFINLVYYKQTLHMMHNIRITEIAEFFSIVSDGLYRKLIVSRKISAVKK